MFEDITRNLLDFQDKSDNDSCQRYSEEDLLRMQGLYKKVAEVADYEHLTPYKALQKIETGYFNSEIDKIRLEDPHLFCDFFETIDKRYDIEIEFGGKVDQVNRSFFWEKLKTGDEEIRPMEGVLATDRPTITAYAKQDGIWYKGQMHLETEMSEETEEEDWYTAEQPEIEVAVVMDPEDAKAAAENFVSDKELKEKDQSMEDLAETLGQKYLETIDSLIKR